MYCEVSHLFNFFYNFVKIKSVLPIKCFCELYVFLISKYILLTVTYSVLNPYTRAHVPDKLPELFRRVRYVVLFDLSNANCQK